jgi:predicted N-acetyltransferase YhbS
LTIDDPIVLRPFRSDDLPSVLRLLRTSLRRADDARYRDLFAWKHENNVFGRSLALVAADGKTIVGFRAFMRWHFERGGRRVTAVRAVDTATHPDYQGRGIFRRLTMRAIEDTRAQAVGFVFNTPNAQSRPGYVSMGWRVVGRVRILVRPMSVTGVARMIRSRTPASTWSEVCDAGDAPESVMADADAVRVLLESQPASSLLRTVRSPEYFVWRYPSDLLGYRAIVARRGLAAGLVIFRVRRRGEAREVVLDDVLVPEADERLAREMVSTLRQSVHGDYVIRAGGKLVMPDGFVRLPAQGPILTWRDVCETRMPELAEWNLTMGDVELF